MSEYYKVEAIAGGKKEQPLGEVEVERIAELEDAVILQLAEMPNIDIAELYEARAALERELGKKVVFLITGLQVEHLKLTKVDRASWRRALGVLRSGKQ